MLPPLKPAPSLARVSTWTLVCLMLLFIYLLFAWLYSRSAAAPPVDIRKPVIYLYAATSTHVAVHLTLRNKLGHPRLSFVYPVPDDSGGRTGPADAISNPASSALSVQWSVTVLNKQGLLLHKRSGGVDLVPYLFWEAQVEPNVVQLQRLLERHGVWVRAADYMSFLWWAAREQGLLTTDELSGFITFWTPQLLAHRFAHIVFSRKVADELSELSIMPQPTTVLRVCMLWKGMDSLPDRATIFATTKFAAWEQAEATRSIGVDELVAVEWGGFELK